MSQEGRSVPKHLKLRGEWVELRFMARAAEYGIRAIKPWGDCSRYDFIVESHGGFLRVQVKSTSFRRYNYYSCTLSGSNHSAYTKEEVDLFAVLVIPDDVWYIIPIEGIAQRCRSISLAPQNSQSRYAKYHEAWHLLKGQSQNPNPKSHKPAI